MFRARLRHTLAPASISDHHASALQVNAVAVVVIAALNLTTVVFSAVPMSAGVGFLLWVGILITAQASPKCKAKLSL